MAGESGAGHRGGNKISRGNPKSPRPRGDRASRAHRRAHPRAFAQRGRDHVTSTYQSAAKRNSRDRVITHLEPRFALADRVALSRVIQVGAIDLNRPWANHKK